MRLITFMLFLGLTNRVFAGEPGPIRLRVSPSQAVEDGESFRLTIDLENGGAESLYVFRSTVIGETALNVLAAKGTCEYRAEPHYIGLPETDRRFYYVPLLPGRRIQEDFCLNDPEDPDTIQLPLAGPGVYRLWVTYRSREHWVVGPLWPVWVGDAASNEIRLEVLPAVPSSIERWRQRLRKGEDSAISYFRHVGDPVAAETLIRMIEADPVRVGLTEAIVRQERPKDAAVLRALTNRPELSEARRQFLRDAAMKLEAPSACR